MHDEPGKVSRWSNQDNDAFYTEIGVPGIAQVAHKAGLVEGCDVKCLRPYWMHAQDLLDVGSGFGRVVQALLSQGFQGNITAVERNAEFFAYMLQQFGGCVQNIQADTHELSALDVRFDTILFLWSGLADFAQSEQSNIVKILATLLKPGGFLAIDTIPMAVQPLDTEEFGAQSFLTRADHSLVRTYEPSSVEIAAYAEAAGLVMETQLSCRTDTNRQRCLYVLKSPG